jgi:hypothetical protein
MQSIVIDTIGKMHAHGSKLFAFCADCAACYRPERTPHNPPDSWTVDLGGAHRRARARQHVYKAPRSCA